ncbi:MAG: biotin--[acetyl-CoA-carboxylase] ligase [Thaumarchaeota archaeon]|nr:biotin--[acetyl-CoA-carboxylase] ligase [Nitrososphaerota archaeon]
MLYTSDENQGLVKVLQFLKAHRLEYLSGEDLSEVLKISRVAIWKHIKKIQSLGYKIESKQNLGYRLIDTTNLLLPWEITDELKTRQIGKKIYYYDIIDSTQNFATNIAKDKENFGAAIIAESQILGKGRQGRQWISPKGGIWLSIILEPSFDIYKITLIPFVVAVALANSIEKILGIETKLKWPNDLTLNGKKVAGIIIDASIESTKIESVVVGVGINFQVNTKQIENKIKKNSNFYGVATLIKKQNVKPASLVKEFLFELETILELLNANKAHEITEQWMKKSSTIGQNITVTDLGSKISGKAVGLDKDGSLIVRRGSKSIRITSGDIAYHK